MKGLNQVLLILHFLGLAMGLSVSIANTVMSILIAKAARPEKAILGRFPPVMSRIGKIGLSTLWVTGLILVYTKWGGFANLTWPFFVEPRSSCSPSSCSSSTAWSGASSRGIWRPAWRS